MSAELIILLIGVAFILLAIGDSLLTKSSSAGLIHAKLRIPLGVIGILLIIYGGYSYGGMNPPA